MTVRDVRIQIWSDTKDAITLSFFEIQTSNFNTTCARVLSRLCYFKGCISKNDLSYGVFGVGQYLMNRVIFVGG